MLWELSSNKSRPAHRLISAVYNMVHLALWSLLISSVVFFCVFWLPRLPQLRAKIEAERILQIQAENDAYCDKWGLPRGTQKHEQCIVDLQGLRTEIERRASDDADVFP